MYKSIFLLRTLSLLREFKSIPEVSYLENIPHIPVLYREVEKTFSDIQEGIVIDCTMGYAGHSSLILETNEKITLIGIDQDQTAIDFSTKRLEAFTSRVQIKKVDSLRCRKRYLRRMIIFVGF